MLFVALLLPGLIPCHRESTVRAVLIPRQYRHCRLRGLNWTLPTDGPTPSAGQSTVSVQARFEPCLLGPECMGARHCPRSGFAKMYVKDSSEVAVNGISHGRF